MEPTEVIIARLVLGYLKSEHCRSAYKAFLGSSGHFHNNSQTKNKYFHTRFVGLTLEDILNEYFEIYHIVQGRLEATNYFNEKHAKASLPNQLLYLLNKGHSISRTSTPCPRSPIDSHLDETSPSHQDPNSDVETTPAHTLPGNIRCSKEETYLQKTPRRKHKTGSPHGDSEEMAEVAVDTEVLAQTLLENREFHEKIAQTINKVAEKQHKVSAGLDKTIKTVVKETEEDPIFDKILDEIIGTTNIMDNRFETNITSSSMSHSGSDGLDNRLHRSNKKADMNDSSQVQRSTEIEVQNAEAVQSIVSNATIVSKNIPPINGEQINNEVVVFDGSLDKYIVNSGCSLVTAPIQNQVYINTMGILIPTNVQRNVKPLTDKQFFINNPQANWNVPLETITNQDIVSMPTVIVTEKNVTAKRPSGGQKKQPKSSKPHHIPEIQPKIVSEPEVPCAMTEPITLVDTQESTLKLSIPEATNLTGLKKVIYPKEASSNLSDGYSQPPVVSNQPLSTSTPACGKFLNNLPEIMTEKENANLKEETEKINKTPPPSENVQKVTPKSASHIRNLDFSTPPKVMPSSKKKRRTSKSPSKKQAAKSLFKREAQPKSNDPMKTWDSDLRAVVLHADQKNRDTPKRVTKRSACKSTRRKAKNNEKSGMNTTEQDAAALEAALESHIEIVDTSTETEDVQIVTIESESKSVDKSSEEVTLEVRKENAKDNQSKTILSPSKLNASKRNILETDGDAKTKYITPESAKENQTLPIKANRNIMPMLETPSKDYVPITPGIGTPMALNVSAMSSNMTPFTKMLEANLKGIDISQLPTPNMPITPNFPELTPIVDLVSPFSNRPTDYSTSSSYYQPSDNEQNKSLEAHLLEMEKKPLGEKVETRTAVINEHLNTFNKNMIGKKNLNLVKRNMACSSSSSDESNEDSHESDSSGVNKESNDTVIFKKNEPVSPVKTYCLRVRNATGQVQKEQVAKKDLAKIENELSIKKTNPKPVAKKGVKNIKENEGIDCVEETKDKLSASKNKDQRKSFTQKSVTKELEEKRLRVMNQLKNSNTKKTPRKNNKIIKIKPLNVNIKKRTRKAVTPKKIPTPKKEDMRAILMRDLEHSDDSDWESPPPKTSPNTKTTKNLDTGSTVEKNEVSTSDIEAQNLIEGLKERGIHLMHNKSPKKTLKDTPQTIEPPASLTVENKSLNASSEGRIQADHHSFLSTEDRDIYDIQVFEEETVSLVYNEKNPSQKTFEDYNTSEIIEKTMKTQVFVEEVHLDIDINLKVSQFYSLLEIFPNEDVVSKRIEKQDNNDEIVIETDQAIISKIDNEKDDKIKGPRIKSVLGESESDVCESIKLDNKGKEVKFLVSDDEDKNSHKTNESNQIIKESCEPKSKQIIILDNKCISKSKPGLNDKKCDSNPENIINSADCLQETSTKETMPALIPLDEDDLMNYAVMGSDKEETLDGSISRKRKAGAEESTKSVKKCKTLLKKIDVDVFLNSVHGNNLEM